VKPAFWDSSSVVPLCVQQQASPIVRRLARQYGVVVWWCTPVEARSAFARLVRKGEITPAERVLAEDSLEQLRDRWREVLPLDSVRAEAEGLLRQFSLRAADAMQLVAAMTWTMGRPQGRVFICGDAALLEAARQLGFQAVEA
jgi:predicted nucleic acid-binding protein